jgi:hypothetical protein
MFLTLYWNIISQPARAVRALIALGNIEATITTVDLLSK